MKIGELIHLLDVIAFDGDLGYDLEVHLFADQEGLMTMTPESVTVQQNSKKQPVVLISAWEPPEYDLSIW